MAVCMTMPTVLGIWAYSMVVLSYSMVVRSYVLLPLALQGFLEPLFFLELSTKTFLSIKIQVFLLKVR